MDVPSKSKIVFDPLYGFIHLTNIEWEIIHTPFYQRLKWIKQLGFTFYTFPGGEHSRFGHSIGVMFNAHKILLRLRRGVSEQELFDDQFESPDKKFHQSIRLAALLHDLGTFMFSHTTEMAYIRYGETTHEKNGKGHPDDHEHLGSYIIKNTDYPRGITSILKKYKLDPQNISNLVKGVDPSILACQILHSEIDCDRMDYLLRDAHYSGIKYGTYDRDYLLHHFRTANVNGQEIVVINHNALHAVEDFLMARFAWYSQVVRSARGARFDVIAEEICFYMLEKGLIYTYSQLMEMITDDPDQFFTFNDHYFMQQVHHCYTSGLFDKNQKIKDMAYCLLFGKAPRTIRCEEFKQRILNQDEDHVFERIVKKAEEKAREMQEVLRKKGSEKDWIVVDIPKKHIIFVKSRKKIVKSKTSENLLLERDPAKILMENGDVKLLGDVENSIISDLQKKFNFVPNVYCSDSAYQILLEEGFIN